MLLKFKNLTVRNATVDDAKLLAAWWNDGTVMAHAGFPNGTGEKPEEIALRIQKDTDEDRRMIIELDDIPIGEMHYSIEGENTAEIGIKICNFSKQDKGYGKIILSMLISSLFQDMGYKKIILDTRGNNKRAQHVYEELGFKKVGVRTASWKNEPDEFETFIDYEMRQEDFVNFAK